MGPNDLCLAPLVGNRRASKIQVFGPKDLWFNLDRLRLKVVLVLPVKLVALVVLGLPMDLVILGAQVRSRSWKKSKL